ncbi:MAG: trypsin-like peptidase domain-containing protein [Bacteroidetes bacterium]|nr:trypsin-like peptidase domain-containing protein [Bacteroidota bacterium]
MPDGDNLAVNENNEIHCTSTQGSFTQNPSTNYIQYSAPSAGGASGSPVFDEFGNLVAVNYMSMGSGQSFNRGILAKHLDMVR